MGEIIFLLVWAVFILVYFTTTSSLPSEAKHFPYFLLTLMSICIVYLLYKAVRAYVKGKSQAASAKSAEAGLEDKKRQERYISLIMGGIVMFSAVYAFLWHFIGFELSTVIYLFTSMLILGVKVIKSALISIGTMVGLYLIFVYFLKMNLPVLIWF